MLELLEHVIKTLKFDHSETLKASTGRYEYLLVRYVRHYNVWQYLGEFPCTLQPLTTKFLFVVQGTATYKKNGQKVLRPCSSVLVAGSCSNPWLLLLRRAARAAALRSHAR